MLTRQRRLTENDGVKQDVAFRMHGSVVARRAQVEA